MGLPHSASERENGGHASQLQVNPLLRDEGQFQLSELGDWYYQDLEKKLNLRNTTHLVDTDKVSSSGDH